MEQRRHRFVSAATHLLIALGVPLLALAVTSAAAAMHPVPAPAARAIQVRVAVVSKGDVGHYAGMCGNPSGTDSLDGVLDLEDLNDDGTAHYSGRVIRITEVVACGTKPAPTEDQVAMCSATLSGRAVMDATVEVYEDNRGVWVKSEPVSTMYKQIRGCPEPGDYLKVYPADGWMSGLGIEDVPSGMLLPGTWTTGNVTLIVY
jgi:hypothetical protein